MNPQPRIIDGDGHIFEDGEAIGRHFPYAAAGGRLRSSVFPLHSHIQILTDPKSPRLLCHDSRRSLSKPRTRRMDRFYG